MKSIKYLHYFRNVSQKILPKKVNVPSHDLNREEGAEFIRHLIIQGQPFMVARYGFVELSALLIYFSRQVGLGQRLTQFLQGNLPDLQWNPYILNQLHVNAGFFPSTPTYADEFSKLLIKASAQLDLLGSWPDLNKKERYLKPFLFPNCPLAPAYGTLEPFLNSNPWSMALAGKKVLVVHPFAKSIELQYLKRENLFEGKEVLPEFELKTYKAIQSIAGNEVPFKNWFDAFYFMKNEISLIDFDIAILGCGAYGFPLAAEIKKMGKQAIHMGGVTQTLFGIKGKRFDDDLSISRFYNKYWVRPLPEEVPGNHNKVENGCYW